jgi:hypothetical protein
MGWTRGARRRVLRSTKAGMLLNEPIAENGPAVFAHACRLGTSRHCVRADRRQLSGPVLVRSGSRSAILRPSRCSPSEVRTGTSD